MNPRRISARLLLLLGALAAFACAKPEPPPPVPTVDTRGLVTSIRPGSTPGSGAVRVEGAPRPDVRYDKADVAVLASTRIVARTGLGDRPAVFADLELGDRVQVVFQGPVSKSRPVRAVAHQVVILEKVRGFAPEPPPQPIPNPVPEAATTDLAPAAAPPPAPPKPPRKVEQAIVLRDVRTGDQQVFDRVVFEFEGPKLPRYEVELVKQPAACASGAAVKVAGRAFLQVRLTPARAHNDAGAPTVATLQRTVRLPVIREIRETCDYEGVVIWVVGLAARKSHRVLELEEPARLVIDVER
ncbi:MAG TPA: hypothetical protein DD490_16205 [Acidobacteria bacterium]|nr:hypothetical protein [Acidobacteriota bacterium]